MWTSLNTPVAAFAFFVADHDDAGVFGLAEGFFGACGYAFGVFAGSACESYIKEGFHADNSDSAAQGAGCGFAFFCAAGIFADSAACALGWVNGDEFSLGALLGWHLRNQIGLRYLNISVFHMGFE